MMKLVKPLTFLLMAGAACLCLWFVSVLKPASVGAFLVLAAWLVAPYSLLSAALIFLSPKSGSPFQWFAVAALVTVAGMLMLADVIFWHKDAQGAIAVLMVPLFQGAACAVLLPLALCCCPSRCAVAPRPVGGAQCAPPVKRRVMRASGL